MCTRRTAGRATGRNLLILTADSLVESVDSEQASDSAFWNSAI
jgi:hypothetical protein